MPSGKSDRKQEKRRFDVTDIVAVNEKRQTERNGNAKNGKAIALDHREWFQQSGFPFHHDLLGFDTCLIHCLTTLRDARVKLHPQGFRIVRLS
jgi:hypothetical protein